MRLWGRGQDLTLNLCDHDEEYPRVYDVTFCAGPVFGDPHPAVPNSTAGLGGPDQT